MNNATSERDKYSSYCKEHAKQFGYQLTEEANQVLLSWPARSAVVLLAISSVITYVFQSWEEVGNPYAVYALLAYLVPVTLIAGYPAVSLIFSTVQKYGTQWFDMVCISGMLGFSFSIWIIFSGSNSSEALQLNQLILQGQVAFVIALGTAFSYHDSFGITLVRNTAFTIILLTSMYMVDERFLVQNLMPALEGFFLGLIISWVTYDGIRARFYLKSTDANTRQHLYNQLSKLVYPHQLERIKLGDELENTMPLKEGKAIINVFDVQRSSEIRHEKTADFFVNLFQAFLQICMKGYEHNPLRSQAFRLKETGDGFISSVGYPFLPVDSRSLADSAVSTALLMFDAFNKEVERFNYSRPIKAAIGLAYNSVQGTFQSGGIRSYDLFGEALIQASKYEELRKQPILWNIFTKHAAERGFTDFNILIVQEVVYNSLSPAYRELFSEIDLRDKELVGEFQMMYDNDARYIYFHLLP